MRKTFLLLIALLALAFNVYGEQCNNGDVRQCGATDVGECAFGTQTCSNNEWGICQGARYPRSEACFDQTDNDCDGSVDENCDCISGETRSCGVSNKGICRFGKETCVDNVWGSCENAIYPELSDLCNDGIDNDCDGQADENCAFSQGTCLDKIKNNGETGVDCGGPCPSCGTCSDGMKNQNETGVDCGGTSCPSCATCSDRIQNQDEEEIDCGGPCDPCKEENEIDSDLDTLTLQQELKMGTDPSNPDSDYDKVQDNLDEMPLCPNTFCDMNYNENEGNCPEDCKKKSEFSLWPLMIIVGLILLAVLVYFLRIRKSGDETSGKDSSEKKKGPTKVTLRDARIKSRKSRIEEELEKSMERSSKLFKK